MQFTLNHSFLLVAICSFTFVGATPSLGSSNDVGEQKLHRRMSENMRNIPERVRGRSRKLSNQSGYDAYRFNDMSSSIDEIESHDTSYEGEYLQEEERRMRDYEEQKRRYRKEMLRAKKYDSQRKESEDNARFHMANYRAATPEPEGRGKSQIQEKEVQDEATKLDELYKQIRKEKYGYIYGDGDADADIPLSCDAAGSPEVIARALKKAKGSINASKACAKCKFQCQQYLDQIGNGTAQYGKDCAECLGCLCEEFCKERKCCSHCPGSAGGHYHGSMAAECLCECFCRCLLYACMEALCPRHR